MPEPTLEEVLLRKAQTIGAQPLPEVTQARMPLIPGAGGWINPANKVSLGGAMDELKRLATIDSVREMINFGKEHNVLGKVKDKVNSGIDWMLGYDPNLKPVGEPYRANKIHKY